MLDPFVPYTVAISTSPVVPIACAPGQLPVPLYVTKEGLILPRAAYSIIWLLKVTPVATVSVTTVK